MIYKSETAHSTLTLGMGYNLLKYRSFFHQLENISTNHFVFETDPKESYNMDDKVEFSCDHVPDFFLSFPDINSTSFPSED